MSRKCIRLASHVANTCSFRAEFRRLHPLHRPRQRVLRKEVNVELLTVPELSPQSLGSLPHLMAHALVTELLEVFICAAGDGDSHPVRVIR